MISRRKFLQALACVPAAPVLLRGMSWAAAEDGSTAHPNPLVTRTPYTAEVPPATILPWAGPREAPPGWLPCDGRAVPKVAYSRLYEALGAAYGGGRFVFRVPDLRSSGRPIAALRADDRLVAEGRPPAYLGVRYVVRT